MKNIDDLLNELIMKYDIDEAYPQFRISLLATQFIKQYIMQLGKKRIAFVGNDNIGLKRIKGYKNCKEYQYFYINDDKKLNEIDFSLFDEIYIVSYRDSDRLLGYFIDRQISVIRFYDLLCEHGIKLENEFFSFFAPTKLCFGDSGGLEENDDGIENCLYYEMIRLNSLPQNLYKEKFFISICMRDFLYAEEMYKHLEESRYELFMSEVHKLLEDIKYWINQVKHKHLIIYWMDAFNYEYSFEMKHLQQLRKNSYYFGNAYAVTPNTFPTCKNMFCGIMQVSDLGYKVRHIDQENSPLLNLLMKYNYDAKIISGYLGRYFDTTNVMTDNDMKDSVSFVYWSLIKDILISEKPALYLAHFLVEVHAPRFSMDLTIKECGDYRISDVFYKKGIQALDRQLEFYDHIMGDSFYRIYMNDHGQLRNENFHVHFQVWSKKFKSQTVDSMYCHLDFQKIVEMLLENGKLDIEKLTRKYVIIEDVPMYNPKRIKEKIEKKAVWAIDLLGYKGIIENNYVYVNVGSKQEWIGKYKDMKYMPKVSIEPLEETTQLQRYREIVGTLPEEIYSDSKFKYLKFVNKVVDNMRETLISVKHILNSLFSKFEDDSMALRMGGRHSIDLYELLSPDNRKKVACIIDMNQDCSFVRHCRELEVYTPQSVLPNNIRGIVLSSFRMREELYREAEKIYKSFEIIDIYQYLEHYGYHYNTEFINGCIEDYNVDFGFDMV